jgi:hypothetical protein
MSRAALFGGPPRQTENAADVARNVVMFVAGKHFQSSPPRQRHKGRLRLSFEWIVILQFLNPIPFA